MSLIDREHDTEELMAAEDEAIRLAQQPAEEPTTPAVPRLIEDIFNGPSPVHETAEG